jgi:hypothetical protein
MQAFADFPDQGNSRRDLPQAFELLFEIRRGNGAKVEREVAVPTLDLVHHWLPFTTQRER